MIISSSCCHRYSRHTAIIFLVGLCLTNAAKSAHTFSATTSTYISTFHHHHHHHHHHHRNSIPSITILSIGANKYHNGIPEPSTSKSINNLDKIERVFAISDLHTDKIANMEWLKERCTVDIDRDTSSIPGPNDALIIAGDISHKISILNETLSTIRTNLQCHIFFVFGNHEAWVGGSEHDALGLKTSLDKIDAVKDVCRGLGVHVDHQLVGTAKKYPVWIAPMEGWYDGTLTLEGCEDLCTNFEVWPWTDFVRCAWPGADVLNEYRHSQAQVKSLVGDGIGIKVGRIPLGLTELISQRNEVATKEIHDNYSNWIDRYNRYQSSSIKTADPQTDTKNNPPGLITFSHFLTNKMSLPDWKDPSSKQFMRDQWLDHTVPQVSAKFAKVAGSSLLDQQIRSIVPSEMTVSNLVRHLHVFGHSHRPKDFVTDGVRYIHNPLGKPTEREWDLVSKDVGFQLIWDCTQSSLPASSLSNDMTSHTTASWSSSSSSSTFYKPAGGEVPGKRIIRFWEEKVGGGAFARRVEQKKNEKIVEELDLRNSQQQES